MFIFQAIVLLLFTFTAAHTIFGIITLFIMGALSFSSVPGLQLLVVQIAEKELPGTEDVASAVNIAAFNLGIALGAYIGGITVSSVLGVAATPWIGAIFVLLAVVLTLYSINISQKNKLAI